MFSELVRKNRSYRRFDHNAMISPMVMSSILEAARLCPSAGNMQSLRFLPVTSEEDCAKLFPNLKWAGYLRYWDGPSLSERPTAYILILGLANASKYLQVDTGIAAQTMLLNAVEKGFGGCMLAALDRDKIRADFAIPDELDILLCLALGKPAETVVIEDVIDPDDIEYYRDAESIHHVPKRLIKDLVIRHGD